MYINIIIFSAFACLSFYISEIHRLTNTDTELQYITTVNVELKLENYELKDELYELNELIVQTYIGQHEIEYSEFSNTDDIGLTIQTPEGEYNYD